MVATQRVHSDLCDYCNKANIYMEAIVKTLQENDIDICYRQGSYFFFAFNQENIAIGEKLLNTLLAYATKTHVPPRKLAHAIDEAQKRVHKVEIEQKFQEIIKPHLRILAEESSCEDDCITESDKSSRSSIDSIKEAATVGNVDFISSVDITDYTRKLLIISTAIHSAHEEVISTLCDMVKTKGQKATILRMAGNVCAQGEDFQKAEEYYSKSLELHQKYYVTYSKLGALYQMWSHSEGLVERDKIDCKQKAVENYLLALQHKPSHIQYAKIQDTIRIVTEQLALLCSNTDGCQQEYDTLLSTEYSDDDVGCTGDVQHVESDIS